MNIKNIFSLEEKECDYKGEHYSAREDGMIMRHERPGMRKRKLDNVWTYGTLNLSNGYLFIGMARVHIIVATAFHGNHDSKVYVVDHIDTNRQNNRPDNLRWVTRLDNALMNEITKKKIELICGSIEAFLENPSLLEGHETEDKHFAWMKKVTKEEAKNSLENWTNWARKTKATHDPNYKKKEIGEWIYQTPINNVHVKPFDHLENYDNTNPTQQPQEEKEDIDERMISESKTLLAAQYHWSTPTEFPCCPNVINEGGLLLYKNNLKEGNVFTSNKYDTYYVVDKGFNTNGNGLIVLATNNKDNFMSWSIVGVTIRNGKYLHQSIERKAGKDLSTKYFKYLIGERNLSDEELIWLDAIS